MKPAHLRISEASLVPGKSCQLRTATNLPSWSTQSLGAVGVWIKHSGTAVGFYRFQEIYDGD